MRISEIIKDDGLVLIRGRKENHTKGTPWNYDIKQAFTGKRKGWVYLDQFTKSAMRAIYNALSNDMQKKYDNIHIIKLIDFTWDHIN